MVHFIFSSSYTFYITLFIIIVSFSEIYFKEIIRQQNYFKAQLWQTSEDIRDLKNRQNQTNDNVQNQELSVI